MNRQNSAPVHFHAYRSGTAFLCLVSLLCLGSCRSTPPGERLSQLYEQRENEVAEERGPVTKKVEARAQEALAIVQSGVLTSSNEHLTAALLLYDSRALENVMLARDLALHAVELGDARGLAVAAEAEDIELMIRGANQRYGTQYVYDSITRLWMLYPVNPNTSDSERAAMGIAPLNEALRRVALLNLNAQQAVPEPKR